LDERREKVWLKEHKRFGLRARLMNGMDVLMVGGFSGQEQKPDEQAA
jgi:hypothetical protein